MAGVFGIKTRDENGINLMFPGIQHLSKGSFSVVLAAVFVYTCDILKTSSFLFVHLWFEGKKKKKAITSMRVLSECWWLKRGFGVEALI